MIINVENLHGNKQELDIEEEDGTVFIELKDWDTGDAIANFTFDGTLAEFAEKVAKG